MSCSREYRKKLVELKFDNIMTRKQVVLYTWARTNIGKRDNNEFVEKGQRHKSYKPKNTYSLNNSESTLDKCGDYEW